MVQRLEYSKLHKLSLLHEQLLAAGITPLRVEGLGTAIAITVEDAVSPAAVAAVVTAHDPTALSAAEQSGQEAAAAKADLAAQYTAAMARLDDIVTNGPSFTAAQVRDAVVDLARILRRALRLIRAELS